MSSGFLRLSHRRVRDARRLADRPAPVGVDAEDAGQLGEHAGLLERLPDRALTGSLAELLFAHRDRPLAGIAAPLQQHPAGTGRTRSQKRPGAAAPAVPGRAPGRGDRGLRVRHIAGPYPEENGETVTTGHAYGSRQAGRADRATGAASGDGMPSVPLVAAIRHRQPDVRCYGLASAAK